jgi:prolyl oligopeptidase
VSPLDEEHTDEFLLTATDYITPTTLSYGVIGASQPPPQVLKSSPSFFNSEGLEVTQHFATSEDGTRIPYFMVARKDLKLDGDNPTLLYGYGGFEVSLTPQYNAMCGRAWASQGGVYVEANLRGGGEFGPEWHKAALREKRMKAFQDMIAVARDLISRKVTRPARLGIKGGSNGGLLVGNVMLLAPELFGAVVCQVPLLDMKRYHLLLAGASWSAEYGTSEKDWAYLQHYSPYHNVRTDVKLPPILLTTSTRDDRVHPSHARKFVARLKAMGHTVEYYENIEGGHGGAATNAQAAHMQALAYTFLHEKLFPK